MNMNTRGKHGGGWWQWMRVVGLVLVLADAAGAAEPSKPGNGEAPAFRLKRFGDGKEVGLEDFAGKIVVLDFFAHWCVTCAQSAPLLEEQVQRHYEKKRGNPQGIAVQVVTINVEPGDRRATAAFVKKAGSSLVLNDRDGATLEAYGGASLPFVVVVDGTGGNAARPEFKVVHRSEGFEGTAKLREVIDGLGRGKAAGGGR